MVNNMLSFTKKAKERKKQKELFQISKMYIDVLGNHILQANNLNYGIKDIKGIVYKNEDTLLNYMDSMPGEKMKLSELKIIMDFLEDNLLLIQDLSADMKNYDFKLYINDENLSKSIIISI